MTDDANVTAAALWPEPVERVASFLRDVGAEARLEQLERDTPTAEGAADAIGCTLSQIVKSLVLTCDGAPVVARRVTVASAVEVHEATGFKPGGVAPFPLEHVSAVLVDRALLRHRIVWAGAGSDRHVVGLSPQELLRLTRGRVEDLALESP